MGDYGGLGGVFRTPKRDYAIFEQPYPNYPIAHNRKPLIGGNMKVNILFLPTILGLKSFTDLNFIIPVQCKTNIYMTTSTKSYFGGYLKIVTKI